MGVGDCVVCPGVGGAVFCLCLFYLWVERDGKGDAEGVVLAQRSRCGLTRSILRNPSGLARPMTKTLSFIAQMSIASSFLVSKKH